MKIGKSAKAYSIVTQGIVTILVLLGLGFWIGYLIDKNSSLPGIFAVIGSIIGIVLLIKSILQLGGDDK